MLCHVPLSPLFYLSPQQVQAPTTRPRMRSAKYHRPMRLQTPSLRPPSSPPPSGWQSARQPLPVALLPPPVMRPLPVRQPLRPPIPPPLRRRRAILLPLPNLPAAPRWLLSLCVVACSTATFSAAAAIAGTVTATPVGTVTAAVRAPVPRVGLPWKVVNWMESEVKIKIKSLQGRCSSYCILKNSRNVAVRAKET